MARNRYPEITEARILEAATRLFLEKGYGGTSIQDIVDAAGGITRGAFYHHFQSKEDCFDAVSARLFQEEAQAPLSLGGLSGLEKIRRLILRSVGNGVQVKVMRFAPEFFRSDKYVAGHLHESVEEVAAQLEPLLEEGMADGSLRCRYPREAAELILLLLNIYLSPVILDAEEAVYLRRVLQVGEMLRGAGVPLLDEELMRGLREFYRGVRRGE